MWSAPLGCYSPTLCALELPRVLSSVLRQLRLLLRWGRRCSCREGWALFDRRLAGRDSAEPFEVFPLRLFSDCARFFDALLSNETHFDGKALCLQRLLGRVHTAPQVV